MHEIETFCPTSQQDWRQWLTENHCSKQSIWLIYYKKQTQKPSISWSEAVDEALCFGWIDSTAKSIDSETYRQFFCKRKPNSVWSKINKEKVERLLANNLIAPAGLESINIAQQNGSWSILDDVEALKMSEDLATAFAAQPDALNFFLSLSKSVQKSILQGLVLLKRTETRQKRIAEIVARAAQKLK
jgi:uncharacterized protein YdeI (YjbR/CyaY-like superfamily)